jgi:hypothetical protein
MGQRTKRTGVICAAQIVAVKVSHGNEASNKDQHNANQDDGAVHGLRKPQSQAAVRGC